MAKAPTGQPAVSTAGRLKYADPKDLPSFPSSGLAPDSAAASAAASLGWNNQKTIEPWRPDKTSSASAAAVLAKDYKMNPAWAHQADSAGHKAAMLAVGSAGAALKQSNSTRDTKQDTWGNSAATQAFRSNRPESAEPTTNMSHGSSAATQAFNTNRSLSMKKTQAPATHQGDRSLAAAKGAMSSRPRSSSSPSSPRTKAAEASAASNALNGAALAHRASMISKPPLEDVGAVSVTTMTRNMFTANPPVKPEMDEQANNERLRQSAVDMAKKMYQQQQKWIDQAKDANADEADTQPSPYLNLQDAAYKQAQQRLAKLHNEHQQNREYQEYYGNEQAPKRRFSMAAKLRRRSSSDGEMDDKERSNKIREEMSMFSSKLSQVDKGKRNKDREALLAAAQRNVKARLHGMDEKVYQETGRAAPTKMSDWEVKAQQAAQSRHSTRTSNKGKIDIGGGKFMDSDEIDAIASKRLQPMLDDINEKAEAERERLAILKLEEDARRAEAEKQKTRDREVKDMTKKAKEQQKQEDKAKKLQEKQEEKARKEEEKANKAEQKRQIKEDKRKSKLGPITVNDDAAAEEAGAATAEDNVEKAGSAENLGNEVNISAGQETSESAVLPSVETNISADNTENAAHKTESPTLPTSKVKGWIKNRFSRGKSINEGDKKRRSLFGGSSSKEAAAGASSASLDNKSTSMRDVAMAGKTSDNTDKGEGEIADQRAVGEDSRGVSPVSTQLEDESDDDGEEEQLPEERKSRSPSVEPPKAIQDPVARTSSSPTRDSRFREEMDQ